jgi:hypothetical protein
MKLGTTLGLTTLTIALAATGLLGCSSDDTSSSTGTDGGAGSDTGTHADSGGTTDSGNTADTGGGTDSGKDSGTDTGTTTDGGSEAGLAVSCANYCNIIATNCTAANQEYVNNATCLAMCANMTPGTAGDTSGDTLACRQYHAGAAAGNAALHCRHAGFSGADTCGTSHCAAFCKQDIALCGGQTTPPYASQADCETKCAAYPYVAATGGDTALTSGNTMQCRLYHLEAAYGGGAATTTHCPHTGQTSATCQ